PLPVPARFGAVKAAPDPVLLHVDPPALRGLHPYRSVDAGTHDSHLLPICPVSARAGCRHRGTGPFHGHILPKCTHTKTSILSRSGGTAERFLSCSQALGAIIVEKY